MARRGLCGLLRTQFPDCVKLAGTRWSSVARTTMFGTRTLQPEPQSFCSFQNTTFASGPCRQAAWVGATQAKQNEALSKQQGQQNPLAHKNDWGQIAAPLGGLYVAVATNSIMTGLGFTITLQAMAAVSQSLLIVSLWSKRLRIRHRDLDGHLCETSVMAVPFWATKRSPQQVHAAAASYLNLRVEDTTMAVRSDGEPQLELAFYLRPGRWFKRWLKLAESAAAVQLAPLKASETAMHEEAAASGRLEDGAARDCTAGMLQADKNA